MKKLLDKGLAAAVLLMAAVLLTTLFTWPIPARAFTPGADAAWMGNWADISPNLLIDPSDIAADGNGNIYVVDYTFQLLWKYTASTGTWGTMTPSGQMHPGSYFKWVAVDGSGNVYIASVESYAPGYPIVLMYKESGGWSDITYANRFQSISGIAADSQGNVYAIDAGAANPGVSPDHTCAVYRLASGTSAWVGITGSYTGEMFNNPDWVDWSSPFRAPAAIAVDKNDNVYVVTEKCIYHTVLLPSEIFRYNNTPGVWYQVDLSYNRSFDATGLAIDSQGVFYLSDSVKKHVYAFLPNEDATFQIENAPDGANIFNIPAGIAVDGKDNVYVIDVSGGSGKVYKHIGWVNQIAWTTQPGASGIYEDDTLTTAPAVLLKTSGGETVTLSGITVSVALTTPGGAVLNGTKSKQFTSGAATFGDLSVDKAGAYTLTAASTLQSSQIRTLFRGGYLLGDTPPLGAATIRSSSSNSFTINARPVLGGTLDIDVNSANGALTANTSAVTGGSGAFTYVWSGAGVTNSGTNTLALANYTLGSEITLTVSRADVVGGVTASATVYKVEASLSGNILGDSVMISNPYGKVGGSVKIDYTLAGTGIESNTIVFQGPGLYKELDEIVLEVTWTYSSSSPGADSVNYPIPSNSTLGGTITIDASFRHMGLPNNKFYVNAQGGSDDNDGESWQTAFATLQKALDTVPAGGEVYVAAGTYYPTKRPLIYAGSYGTSQRDCAFELPKDVKIYGGYNAATGGRNLRANETILSGVSDNVYHVVISVGDVGIALLDGFTITGGNADGVGYIRINFNDITIERVYGGGIFIGGGSPTISNCVIAGNTAEYGGGGICSKASDYIITNCLIAGNSQTGDSDGGGGFGAWGGSPKIVNCTVVSNTAYRNGGVYQTNDANTAVTNSIMAGNTVTGGQINATNLTTSIVGGTFYTDYTTVYAIDQANIFVGGGDWRLKPGSPAIDTGTYPVAGVTIPATDLDGRARIAYSGIIDLGAYEYTFALAGAATISNMAPKVGDVLNGSLAGGNNTGTLSYQWKVGGAYAGSGDSYTVRTADLGKTITLEINSSVETGTRTSAPTAVVLAIGTIYVDCNGGSDANNGANWDGAFKTLQRALEVAVAEDEIRVAAGTYYPDTIAGSASSGAQSGDRDKAFVLKKDVRLYGGYDASTGERHIRINETILSGDIGTKDDGSDNSYHVVISAGDAGEAILDGFTISGGNADGSGNISLDGGVTGIGREYGGGIFIGNGSPTISNCVITGNAAVNGGGGICSNTSDYIMINCLITDNAQTGGVNGGGGISAWGGNPKIVNCTVAGNSARASGGVYNASGADIALINSIVAYNTVAGGNTNVTSINTSIVGGSFYTDYTSAFAIDQATIFAGGGDYRLKPGSPALDAGTYPVAGVTIPATDLDGNPRVVSGLIDLGAYERPATVFYVDDAGGTDANEGTRWQTAFATLQKALDVVVDGGEIYVAAGTYYPAKIAGNGTDPRDKAFLITADVKIYGGYDALTGERDIRANETVLSGDIGTKGDGSDNSYHVVISAGDAGEALLDGFTISGGNADGSGNISLDGGVTGIGREFGGGIFISNGNPTISNCVITGNAAVNGGGGICSNTSDYVMINCLVVSNSQTDSGAGGGGGIGAWGGSPKVVNCTVAGNSARASGGVYNASGADIALINSIVAYNTVAGGNTNVTSITTSIVGGSFYTDYTTAFAIDQANIFIGGGDYRLKPNSPAIDAGTYPVVGVTIPATDLDGRARIISGLIDLGAYEYLLLGDINGDNRINLSDLSFLAQYFIGGYGIEERFPMIYTTGDMNRNGELELDDLNLLVYLIVNSRNYNLEFKIENVELEEPQAAIIAAYEAVASVVNGLATIAVPSLAGKPGERVVVPVVIENSPGVKMYQLAMQYDNTKLEFISQSSGPTFAHPASLRNGGPIQVDGDIWEARVTYLGELLAPQTVSGDVILCEFEFEIRDGAAGGETQLTLKPQNSYILSGSGNNVYPEITNGAITIAATEETENYNFRAYMEAAQTNLKAGDTLNVDIMLTGDLNYTQFNTAIAYDANLLEFAGYANLGGLVAEVKKDGADKINVRSVASLNMLTGASCATPVRVVTLKFTVKDTLAAESIATDLSFTSIAVTPAAGVTGVTIAPGRGLAVTIY